MCRLVVQLFASLCFFSRQRYVLGDKAMQRMAESNIFISGVGGIGIEIGEQATASVVFQFVQLFSKRVLLGHSLSET